MCYYCSCTPTVNLHSIATGTLVFPLLTSSPFALQSRDQGLDVEPSAAGGPRSLYSSLSTLGPSQYPTLPLGGSTASGMWSPPYPTLARSPSAGDQSDSVFLESPEDPSLPPGSPDRYCRDPTYSNDSQGDLETDGPSGFQPTHHLHHSLPRQSHGCNQNRILPGEQWLHLHLSNNFQMFDILFKLTVFCRPPQSMWTRRFRISGRGFWNDQPHCLVMAPGLTAASLMAWAQATVWKTRDTWSPRVYGPQPLQPLTTHITWTIWPNLKLGMELPGLMTQKGWRRMESCPGIWMDLWPPQQRTPSIWD